MELRPKIGGESGWLVLAGLLLFLAGFPSWSQLPPDHDLYQRRTQGGASYRSGLGGGNHADENGTAVSFGLPVPPVGKVPIPLARPLGGSPVVATNLGKGDWIWQMPQTMTRLGVNSSQGVINYEASMGMNWITVKCGDGTGIWSQFNATLVAQAHAAGLKIFGWAYAYGYNATQVQGEINVALNALNLGADGFIIDAETEYETNKSNAVLAAQYCQGIRAAYPNTFLAYAPFPYIHFHTAFPYVVFGYYCDAAMPQDYWGAFGITPAKMVTDMDTDWRNWQNALIGTNRNAIKPIVPLGQSYSPVTGAQITAFFAALKADATPATPGGYQGISFWDCQSRNSDMDTAIASAAIGTPAPIIVTPPGSRSVDQGTNVTLAVSAVGAVPLSYQWLLNGTNLAGATRSAVALTNCQPGQSGGYSVTVANLYGRATSSVGTLTVNATLPMATVYYDGLAGNSAANWSLFAGSDNNVADYALNWAYDYSTNRYTFNGVALITPPAPATTNGLARALKVAVNKNDAIAAAAGISLYPKNLSRMGDYVLRFDLWMNYNGNAGGGTGSTEFATFGLNHTGTEVNWGAGTAGASDGLWFAVSGEGGATSDYRAYVGNPGGNPGQLSFLASGLAANGALSDDAGEAFYRALLPTGGYETAGSPGKHWVAVELSQLGGVITWRINGTVVAQRPNTSAFTAGDIMIGYMDIFPSLANPAADNYALFANVRVLIPVTAPSVVIVPPSVTAGGGSVQLLIQGQPGVTYGLETSTNLRDWFLRTTVQATNESFILAGDIPAGGAQGFYRVRVIP